MTNLKADLPQLIRIDEQAAVEHEGRLVHVLVHRSPVDFTELLPLCRDNDGLLVLTGLKSRLCNIDLLLDCETGGTGLVNKP